MGVLVKRTTAIGGRGLARPCPSRGLPCAHPTTTILSTNDMREAERGTSSSLFFFLILVAHRETLVDEVGTGTGSNVAIATYVAFYYYYSELTL